MPNVLNHAMEVGHLTLEERPFDALDALILSQLVYLPLDDFLPPDGVCTVEEAGTYVREHVTVHPLDTFQKKRHELFAACAELPRYAFWEISSCCSIIDQEREMQFSACVYDMHNGSRCIAYRGTDMTLIGWKEDFNMSYGNVPSQYEAAAYLRRAAQGNRDRLYLCGHSKGGNLAVYAAAAVEDEVRERISRVCSFDAPGVDAGTLHSRGYQLVAERIDSYLPQSSIVGMLLNYHPVYTVVKSSTLGVLQHDSMTWQVREGMFVTLPGVDRLSSITDETVHAWLEGIDLEQRRFLVNTLYRIVASSQQELLTGLVSEWKESAERMLKAARGLTPEEKKGLRSMLRSLFATGANEVAAAIVSTLTRRENPGAPEE